MIIRDKAIISDLERFRAMTRDQIAALHFSHCRNPAKDANLCLKRLRRDSLITCSTERRIYVYFPVPSIKKDSSKLQHYLGLCDVFLELRKHDMPKWFTIEPKYGKGHPEPDIFTIWKGAPFWIELQRSVYSDRVMKEKLDRYERYFYSDDWHAEPWQPTDRKVFPRVWIITQAMYQVDRPFKVIQTKSVEELLVIGKK
ncbi:hypothetical protein J31TS4_15670 [Paenibacillus sp. J31TS4]|uniref:replication-relaxation family protein n=1 Tax=Paenibacillus sp. J31TS4 TaxID=2807195 RepID=UPI001B08591B|nr:replication-relaxation family protein [Paenibacillus sp. J31TS4]GIP38287.1 hypothetical protein J31TS4_15670 [Paenibacillus sp. J31TS4]